MKRNYEIDDQAFPAEAYAVWGYRGVAWHVLGWEVASNEDAELFSPFPSIFEERTGRIVARMIGDDRDFAFDPEEVTAIDALDYCASCGQIKREDDNV